MSSQTQPVTRDLSAENEAFVERALADGLFPTRGHVLNAGVDMLRKRQQLLAFVDEGRRQLDEGECTDYDDAELDALFVELEAIVDQRAAR